MISSDVPFDWLHLHGMDANGLQDAEATTGLRLRDFLDGLAPLQAWQGSGTVRGYLADLLVQSSFHIVSPETGARIRSGASLLLVDKTVLFSFPAEPSLLLALGDLSLGYPVCAMVLTGRQTVLIPIRSDWGFAERHLTEAAALIARTGWAPSEAAGAPTLVLGDSNFAHHAWNQLSTLADLPFAAIGGRAVRMVVTHEPLGPIHAIVPQAAAWALQFQPDYALESLNQPGRVFAPVGGSLISRRLAAQVLAQARRQATPELLRLEAALAARDGPVLWLSIRTRNRTAVNQHQLLVSLASAFLHDRPSGSVVLDGHSLSVDLDRQHALHRDEGRRIAARDRQAAAAVAESVREACPGACVLDAVGLTISDSILLGQRATAYVCHHGTVQHKLGWFSATPGLVHSNRAVLTADPSGWVAAQSEVATRPVYVRPEMVEDRIAPGGAAREFDELLNVENYEITDIPAVVAMFQALARDIGHPPPQQESTMYPTAPMPTAPLPAKLPPTLVPPAAAVATQRPPERHLVTDPGALIPTGTLYTDFFHFIDVNLKPRSYFEIGTHLGRSVKQFSCDAACVDPHFMIESDVLAGRAQTHFYQMPSDAFFKAHDLRAIFPEGPDICFLDGMHRSEYLLRDFINTERSCHRRSIVFMHDCLPVNARMALRTHEAGDPAEGHWQHAWTGDVWKVPVLLAAHRPDLKIFYLDCAPTGLVAITNLDPQSRTLDDGYSNLVDELRRLDLDTHTIARLWRDRPVVSARSLVEHPEDLTLFLAIA